jgi:hypothetical protein
MESKKHTGFAIALAWPETYCKQAGAWYEPIMLVLGINKNNYYKAGHAALVLVDSESKTSLYFDFGRYHSPFQHGRVRSAETDHDLEMKTVPIISSDGTILENYNEILSELQRNPACHGEGELHASYCRLSYESALKKVRHLQEISPIPYGPFRYGGSNCSRFVNTSILSGKPSLRYNFRLRYFLPLTPAPLTNVAALSNRVKLAKILQGEKFCPIRKLDKELLKTTRPAPERYHEIPENAQWLSGEGAGSWFSFEKDGMVLKVSRYSPEGVIECRGIYENKTIEDFKLEGEYCITYPSNCKIVSLKLNDRQLKFERVRS